MDRKHIFSALLVVLIWGFNFIAIKYVFAEMSPSLFVLVRLAMTVVPFIFFLPRPNVSIQMLLWLSLFQWMLHFSLLFSGIHTGISCGVSALLVQSQVFFTMFMTAVYFKTRPSSMQLVGVLVSFAGLVLLTTQGDLSSNWLGVFLLTGASLAVSVTNIIYRSVPKEVNVTSLMVWSSAFAVPQALAFSLYVDGWEKMYVQLSETSLTGWTAIAYTVYISALIGIATWCKLMQRGDPIKVVPFSLLVPVVAMGAGGLILNETITWMDIMAGSIVLIGLIINQVSITKKTVVIPVEVNEDVPLKKVA